jgi:dTDP-4-dehydrorhamnose reductase
LETESNSSLLGWFLAQPEGATIKGFNNQLWNGVTVFHFSKFLAAIIENQKFEDFTGVHHVVPADVVTKEALLRYFAEFFNRQDIEIVSVASDKRLDMSLATSSTQLNETLWRMAGYSRPLPIREMIIEYSQAIKSGG